MDLNFWSGATVCNNKSVINESKIILFSESFKQKLLCSPQIFSLIVAFLLQFLVDQTAGILQSSYEFTMAYGN